MHVIKTGCIYARAFRGHRVVLFVSPPVGMYAETPRVAGALAEAMAPLGGATVTMEPPVVTVVKAVTARRASPMGSPAMMMRSVVHSHASPLDADNQQLRLTPTCHEAGML